MINKSNLRKFNPDVYTKITLNDLVVFSIHYLHNKNAEIKSEDIISACFMLFPKRFSLRNHPHWPDSAMVSRHWNVCRSKGYIAAGTEPGFKLTAKGVRLAEKVAKVLGMAIPKHAAKVQPSRPKVRAVTTVKKVQPVVREEKATLPAPVKKIQLPRSKVRAVIQAKEAGPVRKEKVAPPAPTKKVHPVRAKKMPPTKKEKVVVVAQKEKAALQPAARKTRPPQPKMRPAIRVKTIPAVPPAKVRPPTPKKKLRPIWREKIRRPEPVARPVMVEKAQLTRSEKAIHPAVTQEVKVRAGKFVHLMEKSDAYIHYKKNGKSSRISEFDFRSLLLCTMESSPETLARNVEQFKGYAAVHNRQDLVAFLNFCTDKLSYLLVPQTRQSTRRTTK